MVSPSDLPVKVDIDTESFVETMSFYDSSSLVSFKAISSQSEQGLSGTDCYVRENKETEGPVSDVGQWLFCTKQLMQA